MTSPSTISDSTAGAEMHGLAKKLFPICRSLTGDGVRRTLSILQELIPLTTHEVAAGTRCFDWIALTVSLEASTEVLVKEEWFSPARSEDSVAPTTLSQQEVPDQGKVRAPANDSKDLTRQVTTVVRRVLKLPESVDLEVGGMGSIPGWDSLAHIDILLNLERDFGITIPSYEMEKTYTFHALVELIAEIRDTERRSLE